MNLFIFITFCTFVATASTQYYYVSQPAVYHIPPTYNAFSHPFSTYHVNPNFQQFRTVPAPQYRALPAPTPLPTPAPIQRNTYTQNNDPEYRGFAYHTRTDSGATSHVLFVTGPQAQQVNSRVFNNFNSPAFGQNFNVNHNARTIASEMIDSVKNTDSQEEKTNVLPKNIQDLYSPPAMQKIENNNPFQYFQSVLQNQDNPSSRLINFYSKNTDLFAQQVPGYPANVAPLSYNAINPRFLGADNESNNTSEITDLLNNSTEKQVSENKKTDSEVAAESIITNTRFKLNEITEETNETNIVNAEENQLSSLLSLPLTSDPSTDILEISSVASSIPDWSSSSEVPSPSTQRAETTSERTFNRSNADGLVPTTSISSSSEEDSAMMSNATNILYLSGPLNGTSTTSPSTIIGSNLALESTGLLIQRPGNQPPTRAPVSISLNDMPSSSSSESSKSDNLVLKSPKSSPLSNGTSVQGLNILSDLSSVSLYLQTPQDLNSGNTLHFPVSIFNVTETVSKAGVLKYKMAGNNISTEANNSSSPGSGSRTAPSSSSLSSSTTIYPSSEASDSSSSVSSTSMFSIGSTSINSSSVFSTITLPSLSEKLSSSYSMTDEITTLSEINDTTASVPTTEYVSTVDVYRTTDQEQLTTNYNDEDTHLLDVIKTKTFESNSDLARLVDSSLDGTTEGGSAKYTAGNSNEENITTENILITTDAMMTTASQ